MERFYKIKKELAKINYVSNINLNNTFLFSGDKYCLQMEIIDKYIRDDIVNNKLKYVNVLRNIQSRKYILRILIKDLDDHSLSFINYYNHRESNTVYVTDNFVLEIIDMNIYYDLMLQKIEEEILKTV
jgi:hypothetical protein